MKTKRLLRTVILFLVRIIGAPAAYRIRQTRLRKPAPRILLIRPDHLGDLVLTTPVLNALKEHAPDAHITMLVGPWSREIVARHPAIDAILTCPFPGFQRAPQNRSTLISCFSSLHASSKVHTTILPSIYGPTSGGVRH